MAIYKINIINVLVEDTLFRRKERRKGMKKTDLKNMKLSDFNAVNEIILPPEAADARLYEGA